MTPAQLIADEPPDPFEMWKLRSRALLMAAVTDLDTHAMPWTEDLLREMARAIQAVLAMYLQVRWTLPRPVFTEAHVPEVRLEAICTTRKANDTFPIIARVPGSRGVKERKGDKVKFSWLVQAKMIGNPTGPSSVQTLDVKVNCYVRAPDIGESKDAVNKAIEFCGSELNSRASLAGWELMIRPREGYGADPAEVDAERLWDLRVRFTLFLKRFCLAYNTNGILDPFTVFLLRPRTANTLLQAAQQWGTGLMGYRYALDKGQIEAALSRFDKDDHLQELLGKGRLDALFLGYGVGMCGEVYWKGRAITRPATLDELARRYPAQEVGEHLKKFEQSILNDRVLLEVPVHYVGRLAGEEVVDGPSVVVTVAIKTDELAHRHGGQQSAPSQPSQALTRAEAGVIADMAQRLMVREVQARSVTVTEIIGDTPEMQRIQGLVTKVGAGRSHVLITGKSGTGKELVANAIHERSARARERFKDYNCAGQAETLLDDAIFGHDRGAFYGADADREGLFELANGGTLFLDEIGDMPLSLQAKLLRTLETQLVQRLGSNEERKVDVRLICATSIDLEEKMKEGNFRQELYYRVKGVSIQLPSLEERKDDIPLLIAYFLEKKRPEGKPLLRVSESAMRRLCEFKWRGNVRQLANLVGAAYDLCDDVIDEDALPMIDSEFLVRSLS